MFITTVAFSLSAGRIVSFVLTLSALNAELSVFVKLYLGRGELYIILKVSCMATSTISTGRESTAFSTPARMSSLVVVHGVTTYISNF